MDTDKVIDFLEHVAAQLGPLGEQAYNIVKQRVIAESALWFIASTLILAFTLGVVVWTFRYKKKYSGDDVHLFIRVIALGSFFGMAWVPIVEVINLLSPDYATIERILNLVGR